MRVLPIGQCALLILAQGRRRVWQLDQLLDCARTCACVRYAISCTVVSTANARDIFGFEEL